jgi:hypothetical protein
MSVIDTAIRTVTSVVNEHHVYVINQNSDTVSVVRVVP